MNKSFLFTKEWCEYVGSDKLYSTQSVLPTWAPLHKSVAQCSVSYSLVDEFDKTAFEAVEKEILRYKNISIDIQNCSDEVTNYFTKKGYTLREWGTFIIDLSPSEEQLWENIKKETRKLIRRTQEQTTVHVCASEEEYTEYYTLLTQSRKEMGMKTAPLKEGLRMWRIMHPACYDVLYIRDKEGRMLAAMGVLYTKDYMKEVAAARSSYSKEKHIYANDLLKWEFIRWGKQKSIAYYDLAGVNPAAEPGSKDEGIYQFKSKWGGNFVSWKFFEKKNTHPLYKAAKKVYSIIKK